MAAVLLWKSMKIGNDTFDICMVWSNDCLPILSVYKRLMGWNLTLSCLSPGLSRVGQSWRRTALAVTAFLILQLGVAASWFLRGLRDLRSLKNLFLYQAGVWLLYSGLKIGYCV